MSTQETHFYIDTCEICGENTKREWGETGEVLTYYYGVNKPTGGLPAMSPEKSVHACESCRDRLDSAIKDRINLIKTVVAAPA